jgi:hypothetical protein
MAQRAADEKRLSRRIFSGFLTRLRGLGAKDVARLRSKRAARPLLVGALFRK